MKILRGKVNAGYKVVPEGEIRSERFHGISNNVLKYFALILKERGLSSMVLRSVKALLLTKKRIRFGLLFEGNEVKQ